MTRRLLLMTLAVLATRFAASTNLRADVGSCPDSDTAPRTQEQGIASPAGRLSVIQGQVSTMHGDGNEWLARAVDTPLVADDRVATADRSRAEVQLDPFNVMRLDKRTEARVADLQPGRIHIQLAKGILDFSVYYGTCADVEVDTPNMGVHPLAPGLYHIQVISPTKTLVIVRRGEAEILSNRGSTKVEARELARIHGGQFPECNIGPAPARDDFDTWARNRDREIAVAQAQASAQRAALANSGEADRDIYRQSLVPPSGWCWTPAVDSGYIPYPDPDPDGER